MTLNDGFKYEDLECLKYDDHPQITVTKFVDESGVRKILQNEYLNYRLDNSNLYY